MAVICDRHGVHLSCVVRSDSTYMNSRVPKFRNCGAGLYESAQLYVLSLHTTTKAQNKVRHVITVNIFIMVVFVLDVSIKQKTIL